MVLFTFANKDFKCCSKHYLKSSIISTSLRTGVELFGSLSKWTSGGNGFKTFVLKLIFWVCLLASGLNFIFHWYANSYIFCKPLFWSFLEILTSWTTKNKKVSSVTNLHSLLSPTDKSLTYIRKKRGQSIQHLGAPKRMSAQEKHWPFKTSLSYRMLIIWPQIYFEEIWK